MDAIDNGQRNVRLTFGIDTRGMQMGDKRTMHIDPEHLRIAAGISNIDLLNAHKADVHIESTNGKLGVRLHHDVGGDKSVNTSSRHVYVCGRSGVAQGFHAVSTGAGVADISSVELEPGLEHSDDTILKRNNRTWRNMTSKNVTAGVYESKHGDETRYLVAETGEDGTKGAIHTLMTLNRNNKGFLDGKYAEGKAHITSVNGKRAFVLPADHYHELRDSVNTALTAKSDFSQGLGATVTKLSDSEHDNAGFSYVHVNLHRQPVDPAEGFRARTSNRVTDSHIVNLTGGVKERVPEACPAPGFEDVKDATEAFIRPVSAIEESEAGGEDSQ